jgi:hypothetical protein
MPDLQIDLGQGSPEAPVLPLDKLLDITAESVHAALDHHVHEHIARGQVNAAALGMLADDAVQEICKSLRVDAFSLIFRAWAAVRELQEYADAAKHPAGEVNVVRWGKCTVNAPQEVDVRLSVLGVELPVLRLRLDLRADFDSLALTIRDGAIRKATPGPAKATVTLKCGDVRVAPERSTPELQFPHGVSFDPGLPLGWKQ